MRHYATAAGQLNSDEARFPNSARFFCFPAPTESLPVTVDYFSGEVHTLARLLSDIQETVNNNPRFVQPPSLEGLSFMVPRVRKSVTPFIPALRSLYETLPTLNGKSVKSFHEAAIATAGAWHNWLFRFARRGESAEAAAVRFRQSNNPWPFEGVDFESMVAGIEVESDKMEERPIEGELGPRGEPPADGPCGTDGFRFGGAEHRRMNPTAWRLVRYLWEQSSHDADWKFLAAPVFGDREELVTEGMVGSARREANKFFESKNIPFRVATSPRNQRASIEPSEKKLSPG